MVSRIIKNTNDIITSEHFHVILFTNADSKTIWCRIQFYKN